VIFAIFCVKMFSPSAAKGIHTEGRKDREDTMLVKGKPALEASVQLEAVIPWIPSLWDLCDLLCKNVPITGRRKTEAVRPHRNASLTSNNLSASNKMPAVGNNSGVLRLFSRYA
jgi:hypothetical protein